MGKKKAATKKKAGRSPREKCGNCEKYMAKARVKQAGETATVFVCIPCITMRLKVD